MAEWGVWSDGLDDLTLSELLYSYVRRKRWEAKLLATELAGLFARPAQVQPPSNQVSSAEIFKMMGVEWQSD